ncbi:Uncharacterised protein [Serratia marcescens]|nr:hypothetical protein MC51_012675 [Serratia marcescens]MCZ6926155.1 hypothetical protein [Serratia marcescens]OZP49539.1 hypothetical protein CIG46_06465 [Serratia marcescens]OZP54239.1 hypothetical protein CIG37_07980 [Serratia marcescens]OZP59322.1 hypothetical protein CIG56_07975 [Serratia marcescens]
MKTRNCSRIWRYRFALLSMASALSCGIAGYMLFVKPQIPECRAVVQLTNEMPNEVWKRLLLVSIVPDGPRRATVLLNGSFYQGDTRYDISRAVVFSYQRQGSNYALKVDENIRKPSDTVTKDEMNRRLPVLGVLYHLRIEQVDRHHYLVSNNHSPWFVCATKGE